MDLTPLVSLGLAIIALFGVRFALPFLVKTLKPSVQENISSLVLGLSTAYVAIYYVIIPFSRLFGQALWLHG